jgi:outer membrane protein assembly factor BamB
MRTSKPLFSLQFLLFFSQLAACNGDVASWPQFHAGAASHGSILEPTEPAAVPAWEFEVGPVDFGKPQSSPVVGPDGTIYIGNLNGDIIAVNPDGTENWRATTPFSFISTPGISEDGSIYVVGTSHIADADFPDNRFRSTLITISPDGTVLDLALLPDQGFTAGSPKVWSLGTENYVFLHANTRLRVLNSRANALFVFDGNGDLIAREDLGCTLPLTGGPSIFDLLEDLWDLITVEFDTSGLPPDEDDYGLIDPSVGVAERDDIAGAGAALVVIGRDDGNVLAYDLANGDKIWTFDADERVLGTPASLARQIYAASLHRAFALEPSDGDVFRQTTLVGTTIASPVVSASHVYISQGAGFETFDLTLSPILHDFGGRFSGFAGSPAIVDSGAIYTLAQHDAAVFLRAYPGR